MLNSHDIAILGMLASSVLFVTNVVFVGLWIRARERAIRGSSSPRVTERLAPQLSDERQDRLELAVDAIAIEVERIAEGQRFVTRLLAEKSAQQPATPARVAERVITPH